ncbi:MAG: RseA family anti-sigma factor [Pseudomonadota bacterium]
MNQDDRTDQSQRRQALSALMDGEAADADFACRAWRDDAGLRADWHAYQLIGELMRSDDVAVSPQRDARFLGRLRERMAAEPVVLAPAAVAEGARRGSARRAWAAPAAIAAGFVTVAGVVVALRVAAPTGVAPDASGQLASQASAPVARVAAGVLGVDGRLVRNAELDRYLAAHKQYSSTSALAVPGGIVRNAAAVAPDR